MIDRTEKCDNPRCERMTAPNVSFCCNQCGKAHQGSYDVADMLGHSAMCDAREVADKEKA